MFRVNFQPEEIEVGKDGCLIMRSGGDTLVTSPIRSMRQLDGDGEFLVVTHTGQTYRLSDVDPFTAAEIRLVLSLQRVC